MNSKLVKSISDISLPSLPADLSLAHLEAELSRIDTLVRREARRWQLAGQNPQDAFRGLHISDADIELMLARPFRQSWGQMAALSDTEERAFAQAARQAAERSRAWAEVARRQGRPVRLEYLAQAFQLQPFDLDALLLCLAPMLDPRYERFYGYLQDDVTQKRPRINLILDLLCDGRQYDPLSMLARWDEDAPLFRYHLLERVSEPAGDSRVLLNQSLVVDETVLAWLLGRYSPRGDLRAYISWTPVPQADEALLTASFKQQLAAMLAAAPLKPLIAFCGPDELSRQAAAHSLAAQLGQGLLSVNLTAAAADGLSLAEVIRLALRDAHLIGGLLCLDGWDVCLIEGRPSSALLSLLCAHPGWVVLSGQAVWQMTGIERERRLFWFEFALPEFTRRQALWQHFLGETAYQPDADMTLLSGQFQLTSGQIRDVVAAARDMAAQRGESLHAADLLKAARAHSNPRLGSLARQIRPRYEWSDIILPADQLTLLREIVDTVRGRPLVLEQWGVGKKLASSAGVTVLFAGPPGTGKTMAAEIIAKELELDLYKIDLSTIVSKYIGETEKNLEQIFQEAQSSNAILFFDEADAIFGKRSEVKDAHDRYANIEISYLLQRMEAYDGVTILATNLRANLDEAFTRRLQFAVDFPFPESEYRLRIWQTLFPADVPRDADIDFETLSRRFKLAGGNIRNIIVSAAFLAAADGGRVSMRHLAHGTRRELQKMGRLINETDLPDYATRSS